MSVESSDHPKIDSPDSKSEFFELLKLADELQDKCDHSAQRVLLYRAVEVTAVAALVATVGMLFLVNSDVDRAMGHGLLALLFGLLYAAGVEFQLVSRVRRRLRRDERALSAVVELLRETERSFAEQNHLSRLERARLKLEMSRFGI